MNIDRLHMSKTPYAITAALIALCLVALTIGKTPASRAETSASSIAIERARQHMSAHSASKDARLVEVRESISGRHFTFQQTVGDVPVFGRLTTVSVDNQSGEVALATGAESPSLGNVRSDRSVPEAIAEQIARRDVGANGPDRGPATVEDVYYPFANGDLQRAWQVFIPASEPLGDWLVVVSANDGSVLHKIDILARDHAGSTGQVFDPNPIVSSGATIPPPVDCDSAPNEAMLAGQYVSPTLLGITAAQGQLVGAYADLTAPGIVGYKAAGQANEAGHVYNYGCDDDRFEEVNVYYHVDTIQRLIQALGFTGGSSIHAYPMRAHAHYGTGCNAFYSSADYIVFLDGCVVGTLPVNMDWAEEGEVIAHEYGHALQDYQVSGAFFSTPEGLALAEAFADVVAATTFGDPCMFEWTVAVAYPALTCLRNLDNTAHYPEDVDVTPPISPHTTGLIWGGAIWDIAEAFGGDQAAQMKALRLSLQSNFYLNSTAQFADAAAALRQADIDLYGGADLPVITSVLYDRGFPLDSDEDGCDDGQEFQTAPGSEVSGGLRNAKLFWDFFDTPTGMSLTRDKSIAGTDFFALLARFGSSGSTSIDPLTTPPAAPAYHTAYDRGASSGPNTWNLTAADGAIAGTDSFALLGQFGHSCA